MKRLLLILLFVPLMGQECEPPKPGPDDNPYCYGSPTVGKQVRDGVSEVYNTIFGGEESTDRRSTLRIAKESSRCSGVAVGPHTALTAAHCVRTANQATAALGGYGVKPYWDMTSKAIHPDTDLAIISYDNGDRDEGKVLEEPYISKIFDPLNPYHASRCLRLIAQGWGRWEESALSLRECTYKIDEIAWDGELYISKHGPDGCRICMGDSGGPLYAEMDDGSLMLAGITRTTWGECTVQSGHNALQPYSEWLTEQIH